MLSRRFIKQPRGFAIPLLVMAMTLIILTILALISALVLRTSLTINSTNCSQNAYYAAMSGLGESSPSSTQANFAVNCSRGQYLVPDTFACGNPGDANTVKSLSNGCTYSVQLTDKSSGLNTLTAIGRCGTANNTCVVKVNQALTFTGDKPKCPALATVNVDGATYDTVWFDYNANAALDVGECWLKQNMYNRPSVGNFVHPPTPAQDSAVGLLYDRTGADHVCPTGWHTAGGTANVDWTSLKTYLVTNEGIKMKPAVAVASGNLWTAVTGVYNGDGTAAFNAAAAGYYDGAYKNPNINAVYWGTDRGDGSSDNWVLASNTTDLAANIFNNTYYASVRCVK